MKIDKFKLLKRIVLLSLLLSSVAFFIVNKIAKSYGYSSAFDVVSTYRSNSILANDVSPINLKLNISDSDYEFIKEKRQVALDRGLQINDGENYVPCKVSTDDDSVVGEMRLKGHMTDHLEGEKWSFRVKTEEEILGMYRFSLQHPGTRNYVYEWIYHELLKNEEIIYLKYDFINLQLNEKDLGIYAVEEHFGQHVLDRNNRPKGAILRWNPSLFWEWRIDEFQGMYLDEDYSSYTSSFAEPYDKGVVLKDEALVKNYQIAAYRLEQFRRGEKATSDVFDVDKMAKFHAIIDLVGGHHSLDWSDVKFYYNSETDKIEPVGYESFSIRPTHSIAGQKLTDSYAPIQNDYHAQLFADPIFFEAYIQNLERIADESYLKTFKDKIQGKLNEKIGIVAKEWPHRKFNFDGYFENIRLIRNNLELPKPLHAFVQFICTDSVTLSLAPVSDFPIEIIALKSKKNEYTLKDKVVLHPKARNTMIEYFDVTFFGKFNKAKDLILLVRIPGSSNVFEIEVAAYPSYKGFYEKDLESNLPYGELDTNLLSIKGEKVSFKQQVTTVYDKITIPKEMNLTIYPGQTVILQNDLVVEGSISSHGFSDNTVNIQVEQNGSLKIFGTLKATNTQFTGDKLISSRGATLDFYNCQIYDVTECFIDDFKSKITMRSCSSGNVNILANFNETRSYFSACNFKNSELLIASNASLINFRDCDIIKCTNVSKLNYSSSFNMWSSRIRDSEIMFELTNTSMFSSFGGEFSDFDTGFVLTQNTKNILGHATYSIYKTTTTNFNTLEINS